MDFIKEIVNQILALIRNIFTIFGLDAEKVPDDVA